MLIVKSDKYQTRLRWSEFKLMRLRTIPFFNSQSSKARAANAAFIVASCYIASQLARLASNLILTRLLAPEIFGMMAILNIFIQGFVMFSDMGINLNIIQSKNADKKRYLDTAWTLQVIQGVGICMLTILAAWPLATAYGHSEFFLAFIVLGVGVLVESFKPTKLVLLEKNFHILKAQLIQLGVQLASILIIVLLALELASIWALVIGQFIGSVMMLLVAHVFVVGRGNRFCWDREHFQEIFKFGAWVLVGSFFSFLNKQGDKLVLSLAIPVSLLGVFTLAVFIVESVDRLFTMMISKVALPLFSKYKNEEGRLSAELFYRARMPIEIVSAFSGGVLFFNAPLIIDFLYDDRYSEAGWMLQILSAGLFINIPTYLAFNYFTACGKPKYGSLSLGIQVFIMALGLPLFLWFLDLASAIVFLTTVKSLGYLVYLFIMISSREISFLKELRMFLVIVLGLLFGLFVNSSIVWVFN